MAFSTPKYLHTHVQLTHFSANVFPKTISKNGGKTIDMTVGTENVYNSEKLLIKENGNIKTLDEVVIQDLLKKQVLLPYSKKSGFAPPIPPPLKPGMKIHMKIHSCKYCKKTFSQQHSVKAHERIHTGEKPYSCKYCEKKFSQQQSVKAHERIHTGEKPYSCNNCNYRATSRGNITKHELIHAKERERIANQQNCKI
jgi:uncharacterized Zn-finger protein